MAVFGNWVSVHRRPEPRRISDIHSNGATKARSGPDTVRPRPPLDIPCPLAPLSPHHPPEHPAVSVEFAVTTLIVAARLLSGQADGMEPSWSEAIVDARAHEIDGAGSREAARSAAGADGIECVIADVEDAEILDLG